MKTPPLADELVVGAGLDDPALVEDEDPVGVEQGAEPVGDEDDGPVGPGGVDRLLNPPLVDVVERRGPLVEDQDRRVLEEDAGQGDPLPLAAGEVLAALGDVRPA